MATHAHTASQATNCLPQLCNGGLDAYLQALRQLPLLSFEEESRLATRLRDHQDPEALKALVISGLRFVAHIARGYLDYGLPLADLIQQGNLGLLSATSRFNPDHGVRLISYAVYAIRFEITDYVIRNWRIVKIATTRSQRTLFFGLRKRTTHMGRLTSNEASAIALELNVSSDEVREMEGRLASSEGRSYTTPDSDGMDVALPDPNDAYVAIEDMQWAAERRERLRNAMSRLDERSRDIVRRRWLRQDGVVEGLLEVGLCYGISAERVRQIQQAALTRLRHELKLDALASRDEPNEVIAYRRNSAPLRQRLASPFHQVICHQ